MERMSMKAVRIDRGITQEQLAKAVGVNKKTVSSWERGRTRPQSDKIDAICATLNVTYDSIRWNI